MCLSAFIYLDYFGLRLLALNTLLATVGFYLLLGQNRIVFFWSGFFIGILWFYWISFSFVYYELAFLIPLVILGIATVYGLLFWLIARVTQQPLLQTLFLVGTIYIAPFSFNWLKLDLMLIDTYFRPTWWAFGLFLGAIGLWKMPIGFWKYAAALFIAGAFAWPQPSNSEIPPLRVALPSMHVPQSQRWDKAYQEAALEQNFHLIETAIEAGDDLIVLPESAFPMYLNLAPAVIDKLKFYSRSIAIVAGALTYDKEKGFFNSSYYFHNGELQIAHKIVLVPFGEEIPFPSVIVELINKIFFDGAQDYQKAKRPQDFELNGFSFRSAICFEATTDALYEGHPKYMIAISNNAWFSPSIEQTLQHLLLRYYAKKYQTVIYHSANSGISGVILP